MSSNTKNHPAAPPHAFAHKLSAEEINRLPLIAYEGPIHVVESAEQAEAALQNIRQETLLGFDTESRPSFRKGEVYPPALLQLAGEQAVWIFKLAHLGLPAGIAAIFTDPAIAKAGVSNARDLTDLRKLRQFEPAGFVDLGSAAKRVGIQHHGLRGLAAVLLGSRVSKGAKLTNWAHPNLPAKALQYAATDAWIGRRLHETMRAHGFLGTQVSAKTTPRPPPQPPFLTRLTRYLRACIRTS
ncbi:MAG: 3'-5' exonuclease domain-containing protein 2 [Verrucomicrobia bacterium]|nr:3'-5' exonuclease domain-containing protein 2 [Verrucomicrobiota bacterium]